MKKEHPALELLTTLIEDAKATPMNTKLPKETNIKEWTNMPPISEELYKELVKEFNNERHYFFNDSYNLED